MTSPTAVGSLADDVNVRLPQECCCSVAAMPDKAFDGRSSAHGVTEGVGDA